MTPLGSRYEIQVRNDNAREVVAISSGRPFYAHGRFSFLCLGHEDERREIGLSDVSAPGQV